MYLTKEDLEAIGNLIDEKLEKFDAEKLLPIRTDIHYIKCDIEVLKKDVSYLKYDVAVLKDDVQGIKIDIAELKRWRSEVEKHIN
ncbi:MAG: hypothetical protein WDO15_11700 [Bacteroidota bacterium]